MASPGLCAVGLPLRWWSLEKAAIAQGSTPKMLLGRSTAVLLHELT
ncbi:hypothetical protein PGN35_021700 [Nodosilinea sp. PGN35]|nr:hypothetical protein [Nodosilinea sp. TSF1-S3]MDF0366974.1 hypothetical protein [Nodosilinea sp. TSF1-S3]